MPPSYATARLRTGQIQRSRGQHLGADAAARVVQQHGLSTPGTVVLPLNFKYANRRTAHTDVSGDCLPPPPMISLVHGPPLFLPHGFASLRASRRILPSKRGTTPAADSLVLLGQTGCEQAVAAYDFDRVPRRADSRPEGCSN